MNQRAQWKILPPVPDEYLNASDFSPLIAQLLYNRGVKLEDIDPFLSADRRLEGNPFLLPDISQAVSRVYKAVLAREKIAIYGDFDVDGVTAIVILVEGLSRLGAEVITYIPDRVNEGHGLKISALEKLQAQGASLVITVDCGVTDLTEVKQAREMGMDMIITDHHIPLGSLPRAVAVIDPKRKDSMYPYPDLAGAGVAFKFLQALFHKDSREKWLAGLMELVVLATVTDLVTLVGENRYLVKKGLRELNNSSRVGIQEMGKLAGLKPGELDTKDISWVLGPRLNAAGRMDNASTSYQLLTTQSPEEARLLALELERRNAERQKLTNEVLSRAREKLAAKLHLPVLIDGDESYSIGVIGLVAGKLVDEFYKPAIIISLGPELCQGSCRSIPEFDITAVLKECHNLLTTFGGHPLAAGFTVTRQNLAQLEDYITRLATDQLGQLDLRPEIVIDAELPLSTFSVETFNLIQKLSPFGRGNPQPTFLTRQVEVIECRNFGNQGEWLRLKLKQGNITWQAVDFESRRTRKEIPSRVDIVYNLEKSRWNGEEVLSLNLRDFAPAQLR
ncbi:MAG: single-stranded-DNA-specific exonuclease RecJ [Dehalococcoidia bacterium]|nr:MAG: single-stranded-DNA-specific exonuclease RecJ [Dehalococcoidia bacterium]